MLKYKRLIEQLQSYKSGLAITRSQLRQRVLEVFYRYIRLRLPTTGKYKYPTRPRAQLSLTKWDIEADQVHVQWEESWPKGGTDGGRFSFPIMYLGDEVALKAYEESCVEEQSRETQKQEGVREQEIQHLRILQKKYPEVYLDT
jgi:hypothetical protein